MQFCSLEIPCIEGEGDCDNDDQCLGSLLCGKSNCKRLGEFYPDKGNCCAKLIPQQRSLQINKVTGKHFEWHSLSTNVSSLATFSFSPVPAVPDKTSAGKLIRNHNISFLSDFTYIISRAWQVVSIPGILASDGLHFLVWKNCKLVNKHHCTILLQRRGKSSPFMMDHKYWTSVQTSFTSLIVTSVWIGNRAFNT